MSKKYSVIICTQDGEEAARFSELNAPEVLRKIDAAIEVGAFAIVDAAGEKEEDQEPAGNESNTFIIDNRGIV